MRQDWRIRIRRRPALVSPPLPRPAFLAIVLILALSFSAACEPEVRPGDSVGEEWEGTSVEDGPVKTVRTTSGSVWAGDGKLIEEIAIGTETRGEEDLLGEVTGVEARAGRIYVLDQMFGSLRVYDMAGNHLVNIGRPGEGPGEFPGRITGVGIDPVRDHLVVREATGVLHRLTLSGRFVDRNTLRFHYSFNREGMDLRVTRDGLAIIPQYYARIIPGGDPWFVRGFFLYTFDPSGTPVDSLELPIEDEQPYILKAYANPGTFRPAAVPFAPRYIWTVGWDGSFINASTEEYRFEIRHPGGRTTVIEREAQPVAVGSDERKAHVRRVYEILTDVDPRWEWDGPEIPEFKAWLTDIIPDRSGRIWVLREGEGHPVEGWTEPDDWRGWTYDPEWVSELWFEVFDEATGRYLGRVDAPDGFLREPEPLIDGDLFICLTKDEFDRPIVRRYRLELPSSPGSVLSPHPL